ncbi:MAG: sortase [Candidatus Saccharimonadales bacterium]
MSTDTPAQQPSDDRHLQVPERHTASNDPEQRAAELARAQVEHIYEQNPPNQLKKEGEAAHTNPYQRTHQENFDWRNYHSAWQQYYQQYYQRYYWQQLHAERQKITSHHTQAAEAAAPIEEKTNGIITGGEETPESRTKHIKWLKDDLRNKVEQRAQQLRKSHHFVPIMSAVVVGLGFLFLQFNGTLVAQVKAYLSPGAISSDAVLVDPTANVAVGPEPRLIIPKINVDLPVNYNETALDDATIQIALRDGAVHYKLPGANAVPGQFGNTVLLGHSSNDIFNQGAYKFVFVLLDRLEPGDIFYMHYEGKRYIYRVTEEKIINPDEINALQIGAEKPMVTLITCTPPGTALKRLLVFAEQISPDPAGASKPTEPSEPSQQEVQLPGDGKSFFEQVWQFFF